MNNSVPQKIDEAKVSQMIQSMLDTAKKSIGDHHKPNHMNTLSLIIGLVFTVITYFVLQKYKPSFIIIKQKDNKKQISKSRIVFFSLMIGVIVYILSKNYEY